MELWRYHPLDSQAETPWGWCSNCGQEIYAGEARIDRDEETLCRDCAGRRKGFHSLQEISEEYDRTAKALRERISLVRRLLRQAEPEEEWMLQQRLTSLREIQKHINEMARITAHYYDREDLPHEEQLV